jgi:hypothetical protein
MDRLKVLPEFPLKGAEPRLPPYYFPVEAPLASSWNVVSESEVPNDHTLHSGTREFRNNRDRQYPRGSVPVSSFLADVLWRETEIPENRVEYWWISTYIYHVSLALPDLEVLKNGKCEFRQRRIFPNTDFSQNFRFCMVFQAFRFEFSHYCLRNAKNFCKIVLESYVKPLDGGSKDSSFIPGTARLEPSSDTSQHYKPHK